jgi:hypothetical protein
MLMLKVVVLCTIKAPIGRSEFLVKSLLGIDFHVLKFNTDNYQIFSNTKTLVTSYASNIFIYVC